MTQAAEANAPLVIPLPVKPYVLAVLALLASAFLAMEAVHEFGHVVCAWASGGRVVAVEIPLIGTSQTFVAPNPNEALVAEGGAVFGVVIPLLACGLSRLFRKGVPEGALEIFRGLCVLIANGVYMSVGLQAKRNTDAGDLVHLGVPGIAMIGYGAIAIVGGLLIWHRLPWLTWRQRWRRRSTRAGGEARSQ